MQTKIHTILLDFYACCIRFLKRFGLHHIPFLYRLHHLFLGYMKKDIIVVHDTMRLILDPRDNMSLSVDSSYDTYEKSIMDYIIKPGFCVVDIGANIGYYTLFFSQKVGSTGQVFAFEPMPDMYHLLQQNIALNKLHNVLSLPYACGDETTQKLLYTSDHDGDHRLYDDGNRDTISIKSIKCDDFFVAIGTIHFVKIDVQGYEYRVVSGMQNLLHNNHIDYMLLEYWPYGLHTAGDNVTQLVDYLQQFGSCYLVVHDDSLQSYTYDLAERHYTVHNKKYTNLFFVAKHAHFDLHMFGKR